MAKAAIAIENWKLDIFKRHLDAAGFVYEKSDGLVPDTATLIVQCTENDGVRLNELCNAAMQEAKTSPNRPPLMPDVEVPMGEGPQIRSSVMHQQDDPNVCMLRVDIWPLSMEQSTALAQHMQDAAMVWLREKEIASDEPHVDHFVVPPGGTLQ